jgi:hypothetical protein
VQLNGEVADVQRSHVYVKEVATACAENETCEVNVEPIEVLPLGAVVADTVGVKDLVAEIDPQELLCATELAPEEFTALVYGANVLEYQLVTVYEPLLPDAPEIVEKFVPSYEYSQLVIVPPPLLEAEKLTVALEPHDVELDRPLGTPM